MMYGEWTGGDWAWMGVATVLFWSAVIVVVAGVIWLVRALGTTDHHGWSDRARSILDERYARGELTDDEYEARRRVLAGR